MVVLLMLMLVLLMAEVLLWVGGAMPWWEAMWCERASDTIGMRRPAKAALFLLRCTRATTTIFEGPADAYINNAKYGRARYTKTLDEEEEEGKIWIDGWMDG